MNYIVVNIDKTAFMAVTKEQNKLGFKTRPVGYVKHLIPEMKDIANSLCDLSTFENPYLLQII